jgi:hypothetical protein
VPQASRTPRALRSKHLLLKASIAKGVTPPPTFPWDLARASRCVRWLTVVIVVELCSCCFVLLHDDSTGGDGHSSGCGDRGCFIGGYQIWRIFLGRIGVCVIFRQTTAEQLQLQRLSAKLNT